jgi:uncharacterized protein with PQ loop repeat
MPRPRIYGYLAVTATLMLGVLFVYSLYQFNGDHIEFSGVDLSRVNNFTFFAVAVPVFLVSAAVIGTGFWIGWTILTIKVVPPMPDIVEKKDYSKIKAFFLCVFTLLLGALLLYGIYLKNFWALAIPAAAISLVVLGAVFWVGLAIITTRSTLPEEKK